MIRVLVQRVVAPGMESTYDEYIRGTIQAAVAAPGFISGESLHDIEHPNVRYVIIKMRSVQDWHAWYHSDERIQAVNLITPLLLEPEGITLLSH